MHLGTCPGLARRIGRTTLAALIASISLAGAGCATSRHAGSPGEPENEEPVLLEDCPGPVQAALLAEAFRAGGIIGPIEREREPDGSVAYEGTVHLPDGREVEVEVAPDGTVIEVENEVENEVEKPRRKRP